MKQDEARNAPLEIDPENFRQIGHALIDRIADFMKELPQRPVTTGEPPSVIKGLLGDRTLPQQGQDAKELVDEVATLLFDHSLFNGHPRFFGYITSSAAPIGALADLLAATVNSNVGAWILAPVATEIELLTIRWIAEMVGYPTECGGILVSGGNAANFICALAARRHQADWPVQHDGMAGKDARPMTMYASTQTHTWVLKAADMYGTGTDAIRWIDIDADLRMDTTKLRRQIEADLKQGYRPWMVVAAGGSVPAGVVDPLDELADLCAEFGIWFHVDGAYGAFAALSSAAPDQLRNLGRADSLALDPHKWLYAPLEAGCALIKNPDHQLEAFSYRPDYFKFDTVQGEPIVSLVDYSPQNSRGFRALKVWLSIRQVGREGFTRMISDDISLAKYFFELAQGHAELQAFTHHLSITTFRYVPSNLDLDPGESEPYLKQLNTELLTQLQESGEAFVSNAVIKGTYLLRACVVNFRSNRSDIEATVESVVRLGRETDARLRPEGLS